MQCCAANSIVYIPIGSRVQTIQLNKFAIAVIVLPKQYCYYHFSIGWLIYFFILIHEASFQFAFHFAFIFLHSIFTLKLLPFYQNLLTVFFRILNFSEAILTNSKQWNQIQTL